ncbi:hypothetical protein HK098_002202 [Nowakowskiella sp. JEL0407]|nr:hypothetical protein HK098_002202 [Nowakowskiella sp. JEL0407]
MILWWSCPILFIEWWYAGAYIFARIRLALSCILIPTIYLAYVDQIAIRDRIWVIEEPTCTGITMRVIGLGDLPVEEFFFFLVTNCMVVCGYFAFERGESVIRILMTEDGKRKRDDLYFDKTFDGEVATRSALSKKPNYQLVQYVVQSFSKSDSDLDQSLIKDFSVSYHALVEGSKSFSAALKVFPDHIHFDIIALYAFCRLSDDIADDEKRGLNERKELFRMLTIIVDDIWSEDMGLHEKVELSWSHLKSVVPMFGPVMRNLVRAGLYRKIPKDVIAELLSGYEWDLESKCIETNEDLILYANKVASSVGEAMLCLMINRADKDLQKSARDMGVALQLVNCARDIITDAKIGRCYVPTTLLESTFVPDLRKSLLHDPSSVPLTVYSHLALELIRESKPYQESAKEGISKLPRMYRRPIRSALRIYMGIGKEIENEYPGYVERDVFLKGPQFGQLD